MQGAREVGHGDHGGRLGLGLGEVLPPGPDPIPVSDCGGVIVPALAQQLLNCFHVSIPLPVEQLPQVAANKPTRSVGRRKGLDRHESMEHFRKIMVHDGYPGGA